MRICIVSEGRIFVKGMNCLQMVTQLYKKWHVQIKSKFPKSVFKNQINTQLM